jgi:formylmethanofuran dehydrogenase subunit E
MSDGRWVATTHCNQGHEYTPENTMTMSNGRRRCRACNNTYMRKYLPVYRKAKRAAA